MPTLSGDLQDDRHVEHAIGRSKDEEPAAQVNPRPATTASCLALAAGIAWGPCFPAFGVDVITAARFGELIQRDKVVLIDVRTAAERSVHGVPKGSDWIEWRGDANAASFIAALERLQPDRTVTIAFICSVGHQSGRVARRVEHAGYLRVYDVGDGMNGSVLGPGWTAWGLPVEGR
jgi:rhodanese-related sulfurtransferase